MTLPDKAVEAGARAMIAKAYGDHAEQNFGEHFGDLLDAVMADFRSASIGISAALAAEGLVLVPRRELTVVVGIADRNVTAPAIDTLRAMIEAAQPATEPREE